MALYPETPFSSISRPCLTSPARSFLNSSFNGTASSRARELRPTALVHPDDAARLGVGDGDVLRLGNGRGTVRLHAKISQATATGQN